VTGYNIQKQGRFQTHRFESLKTQHSISIIGFKVMNTVIRSALYSRMWRYSLVQIYRSFGGTFWFQVQSFTYSEDRSGSCILNVCTFLSYFTASHPKRQWFSFKSMFSSQTYWRGKCILSLSEVIKDAEESHGTLKQLRMHCFNDCMKTADTQRWNIP
jgi:hypothetical protein